MTGKRLFFWNLIAAIALLIVLFVPDPAFDLPEKPQNLGYLDRSGQVDTAMIHVPFDPTVFERKLSKFP